MTTTAENLKLQSYIDELFTRITSLEDTNAKLVETIARQDEIIAKQAALIDHYEGQIRALKRRQFGISSERVLPEQLTIFGEIEIPSPPPEIEEIVVTRKKRKGKREEDLANLPVVRVDHELPDDERDCPECTAPMRDIGVKTRYEIDIIPAQAIVKEHAVHSYACQNLDCEEEQGKKIIITADSPRPLIARSLATPSLVAHIAYQKYSNGMPLYRIEKGFLFDGVNISRQNMCSWVIKCSQFYLMSIYDLLKAFFLKETYIHSDATTVQVLKEVGKTAQSKSTEWVYCTSAGARHKIKLYEYKPSHSQKHPLEFLRGFKGYLHTDGHKVYRNLPPDIIVVGCWAHARRYLETIWKALPEDKRKGSDADTGLQYINALFRMEREFVKLTPNKRYEKRLLESKPISDAFFAWADKCSRSQLPKSPLGEACTYAKNQRNHLENIFLDGKRQTKRHLQRDNLFLVESDKR